MRPQPAIFLIFIFACLALSACTTPGLTATLTPATPTAVLSTAQVITPASPTSAPTAAPAKALLVAPEQTGDSLAQAARTLLSGLVAQSGLTLEVRSALKPEELTPNIKVVVFMAQPANLTELLAAAPASQFVVITSTDLAAKGHLSVVRTNPEHLAFVAGYVTTIISPDWRSAGLLPDQPGKLVEAFQNGGRYWCGRCTPNFAPVVFFPVGAALPASSTLPAWQTEFEKLKKNILETVYLPAEVSQPELLDYLLTQKVNLVGGQAPGEVVKARWAVTVRQDPLATLKALWPDLTSGKGGRQVSAAITFSDINESLFTPGKQRLALEVIQGLADGTIAPLSVAP